MQDTQSFFSFNKPLDWEQGCAANMDMSTKGLSIRSTEKYGVYRIVRLDELEGMESISDASVTPSGKLLLMDDHAGVWVYDDENQHREPLFRQGHPLFSGSAMLASLSDVWVTADPNSERRLGVYAMSNGQTLWAASEWNGLELLPLSLYAGGKLRSVYTLVPITITVGMNGNLEVPAGGQLVVLEWSEAGETIQVYEHESLRLEEAASIEELRGRFSLSAYDETVAVLDSHRKGVTVFFGADRSAMSFTVDQEGSFAGISIDTNHNLYIGSSGADWHEGGNERFILKYRGNGEFVEKVSGFRGRAEKLLHDSRNRMYVFDRFSGQITRLELQARTMTLAETGLPQGVYFSAELDTTETETIWHKIRLDADIPEETQIRISYFASDRKEGLLDGQFVDYTDFLTSEEVSIRDKLRATGHLWSEPIVNPQDALLMKAQGQYLWLKIELLGSGQKSPLIRKLRVYFPRTSLLTYLPAIYQQDEEHSPFLERFLALFGTFFDDMEDRIERISANFDADAVSGPYLEWLGRWLAISDRDSWGEVKLRQLIREAPTLYKLRGTREGLIRMLRIYTGTEPFLLEYFQFKQMQETSELRRLFEQLYGDNPYCFCVMLPPEYVRTDQQRMTIESIIEDGKPAYTDGKLIVLQPWMYADMHTYLGINTYLSEPTLLTLDERSSMPYNTVLIDVDRDKRMDIHTRLELDSELD
ncbi:phage tail protein [Paenibacillus hexagrammi]|uniref:Phage tail protein n=1 Tax=Paenibacillus hexagrammi TaxID=2908839 RepID=A0ABY3SJR2_9BACL|nr:phage tail protein [Paenibacillus sp. YPD9-1]UJF34082.1 phage tail protein [Paenibacillus sp. YPD9-1]